MLRLSRIVSRPLQVPILWRRSTVQTRWSHGGTLDHDLLRDLEARGLISQVSSPEKLKKTLERPQTIYSGVDPTAKYLHVGHLLPLLCLVHFRLRGHRVIPLIGGATGLVGDPSGRDTERPLSEAKVVQSNAQHLVDAIHKFFDSAASYAQSRVGSASSETPSTRLGKPEVMNNLTWLQGMGLLEFLRTAGLHARVNSMIARESVQSRLSSHQGISFTEFTYQLLQAYDFYYLHTHEGCNIQLGGSDQWGNIVAGIELIHKIAGQAEKAAADSTGSERDVYAITTPLLTTPSGQKFGKSAGNAVALDESVTSVFDFFQFFMRTPDSHVGPYLRMFTLLSLPHIDDALRIHEQNPEARTAQRLLACELTELVHGKPAVTKAQVATRVLYESDYTSICASDVIAALDGDPRLKTTSKAELLGTPLAKLAVQAKLISSNSEARRLVASKGLYLNNMPVQDFHYTLSRSDLLDGRFVVVRSGSQKQLVLVAS